MNKWTTVIISLLLALHLSANDGGRQQLVWLFSEAEQCYLMDDYQQLESCIKEYATILNDCQHLLGDSADVFQAYYSKMRGAFCYGLAEKDSFAQESEHMYRMSLNVFRQRHNVTNEMVIHEELAQLYYKTRAYRKAKEQLDSVFNYYDVRLNDMGITSVEPNYYRTLSQLAICHARLGEFQLALRQIDQAIDGYFKKQKNSDYYEALRKRGKILILQADQGVNAHYRKAAEAYRQYVSERYTTIEKEMNSMNDSQREQYWLATHQFLYDCYRLGNHAPEMLYDLALFSKDYLIRKNATRTTWKQVKQSLGKDDCALEFVQYFGKEDEKRMGCLVLKQNSRRPLFIDLFATDSVLGLPLTHVHTIGSAITYTGSTVKDTLYNNPQLSQLVWSESLMRAIGNAKKVFFSPDGLFHQLAIEYLIPDVNKTCYRLSSTRVLTRKCLTPNTDSALLCGGISYSATTLPNKLDNDVAAYRFLAPQTSIINDLPGARKEIESLYDIRSNPHDTLLTGNDATDEAFLSLLKRRYDIIHLSTHGFFSGNIGIYNDIKPLLGDESMSKSGLLFAGAARTLTDIHFNENLCDGILSAAELSKQDFSQSSLVVLSACQTGLGRLTDDGIYGIQRALKMARANTMILSLWSVNDYSSSMLMNFFYDELEIQSTKDIHKAFTKARQRLMQEEKTVYKFDVSTFTVKKDTRRFNSPQHVNPFIVIDAY